MQVPNTLDFTCFENAQVIRLLEATTAGVFYWEPSEDKVLWSGKVYKSLGFNPGESGSFDDISELIHPDDRSLHREAVFQSKETAAALNIQIRIRTRAGDYIWLQSNGHWFGELSSENRFLLGFLLDVTEGIEASRSLEAREARFRAFFDHCPAAAYIKDESSRHLYGNEVAAKYAGTTKDELLGRRTSDIFKSSSARELIDADNEVLQHQRTVRWSGLIHTESGEERYLVDTKFPVKSLSDDRVLVGGFGVDITEERKTQQMLGHKQRLESLGLLASGIAHDFNNQLAVIAGNAELMSSLDEEGRQNAAKQILASVELGASLCRQLLTYAGKDIKELEVIRLDSSIESARQLLQMSAGVENVLKFDLKRSFVALAETHLHQILFNLVINAKEAFAGPGGLIDVSTESIAVDSIGEHAFFQSWLEQGVERVVRLVVRDNGKGIEADKLPRIFDPFYTTKDSGHGLGLSAVHGILRGASGALGVDSQLGTGSAFSLYFPEPAVDAIPEEFLANGDCSELDSSGAGRRALIVDDNEELAGIVKLYLESFGVQSTAESDSEKALEHLLHSKETYSFLVLDIEMPRLSGVEIHDRVREEYPALPIIFISGYSSERIDTLLNENTVFLPKPFTSEDLKPFVERFSSKTAVRP